MAEAGDEVVGMAAQAADGEAELPAQFVQVATATVLQLAAQVGTEHAGNGMDDPSSEAFA